MRSPTPRQRPQKLGVQIRNHSGLKGKLAMYRLLLHTRIITVILACLSFLCVTVFAVDPPPDGGYPNGNTAEGTDALFSVTTGFNNAAVGFDALFSTTTGSANTATGWTALQNNTTGFNNTATGSNSLARNTIGMNNTATGEGALFLNTTGSQNTADGVFALGNNTEASQNTAIGFEALIFNTTGASNTSVGYNSLLNNVSGSNNIALGISAGESLIAGSNNIDIGNAGVADESNTIRLGTKPTHKNTFIAGIYGTTVVNGVAVFVGPSGRLGTITSSARFKDEVKPMDKASEAILALQPVTFRYKHDLDPEGVPQFGLLAEEVAEVDPDLVACDEDGKPYTVRYEAVNAMLLNEFLKEHRKVKALEAEQKSSEARQSQLEKQAAQQEAEIQNLRRVIRHLSVMR